MSARNRAPPLPAKGSAHAVLAQPPVHESSFARGLGGVSHHSLGEERRESHYSLGGPRQPPPYPAIIKERLAVQHDDIQALLVDNQRFAATHVALQQELEVAQYELQRDDNFTWSLLAEKDLQMRKLHEKSLQMENELRAVNAMKAELLKVHIDIKELAAVRQDLTAQVQMMTHDLSRVTSDLQKVPAIKVETEGLRQELEKTRAAIEHEKKGFAESFEHGKVMENKLILMAREMEKLRAELANAEKKPHAAAVRHPGISYNSNYGNPDLGFPGYPYSVGYDMMPANTTHQALAGAEGYPPQYAPGAGVWGSYDVQHAQGPG